MFASINKIIMLVLLAMSQGKYLLLGFIFLQQDVLEGTSCCHRQIDFTHKGEHYIHRQ